VSTAHLLDLWDADARSAYQDVSFVGDENLAETEQLSATAW